jgi:hypothetical protein
MSSFTQRLHEARGQALEGPVSGLGSADLDPFPLLRKVPETVAQLGHIGLDGITINLIDKRIKATIKAAEHGGRPTMRFA